MNGNKFKGSMSASSLAAFVQEDEAYLHRTETF